MKLWGFPRLPNDVTWFLLCMMSSGIILIEFLFPIKYNDLEKYINLIVEFKLRSFRTYLSRTGFFFLKTSSRYLIFFCFVICTAVRLAVDLIFYRGANIASHFDESADRVEDKLYISYIHMYC